MWLWAIATMSAGAPSEYSPWPTRTSACRPAPPFALGHPNPLGPLDWPETGLSREGQALLDLPMT